MTDKTRESFEAWFTSKRGAGMLSKLFGGYEWVATSEAWEVWQAATEFERERCALVCKSERVGKNDNEGDIAYNLAINHYVAAIRQGGDA